ncbi:unnamed protein product [Gordionus sp. m RMFG-2023]
MFNNFLYLFKILILVNLKFGTSTISNVPSIFYTLCHSIDNNDSVSPSCFGYIHLNPKNIQQITASLLKKDELPPSKLTNSNIKSHENNKIYEDSLSDDINNIEDDPFSYISPTQTVISSEFQPQPVNFMPIEEALNLEFWKTLGESCNKDGLYKLRLFKQFDFQKSEKLAPKLTDFHLQTFTKSCFIYYSNFSVTFSLNIMEDESTQNINSLDMKKDDSWLDRGPSDGWHVLSINIKTPLINYLSPKHESKKNSIVVSDLLTKNKHNIHRPETANNITVFLQRTIQAPTPDTQVWLQRLEMEKAEKAKSIQGDKTSFLSKYWIYIVIFFVFIVVSGAINPENS